MLWVCRRSIRDARRRGLRALGGRVERSEGGKGKVHNSGLLFVVGGSRTLADKMNTKAITTKMRRAKIHVYSRPSFFSSFGHRPPPPLLSPSSPRFHLLYPIHHPLPSYCPSPALLFTSVLCFRCSAGASARLMTTDCT